MTLAVFFDTNAFFHRDISTDSEILEISDYLKENNIEFYTNRVVLTELANHRERDVIYIRRFYSAWRSVFNKQSSISLQDLEIREFSKSDDILTPIQTHGIKILENHSDDIHLGLEALYKGLKPVKKQNDGVQKVIREIDHDPLSPNHLDYSYKDNLIKDFFIWRSVLSLVNESPDMELVFVTGNHKDFCDGDTQYLHPELASQYASDSCGNIVRVRSLAEFIDKHINFVKGFELRAVDILRRMESSIYSDGRQLTLDRVLEVKVDEIHNFSKFRVIMRTVFFSYEEDNDGEIDYKTQKEEKKLIEAEVARNDDPVEEFIYSLTSIVLKGDWID